MYKTLLILLISSTVGLSQCYISNTICPNAYIEAVLGSAEGYSPDGKYCRYQVSLQSTVTSSEPVTKLTYTVSAGGESVDGCFYGDYINLIPGTPEPEAKDCSAGNPYGPLRFFDEDPIDGSLTEVTSYGAITPTIPSMNVILPCADNIFITTNESNATDGTNKGAPCVVNTSQPTEIVTTGSGTTGITAYPIELKSFSGVSNGASNILSWTTGLENGFSHFRVQHSINATEFQNLAEIGKNESGVYSFQHSSAGFFKSYYRLEMIDLDGSKLYSKIISISENGASHLTVYPNPASDIINVAAPNEIKSILCRDQMGRLIQIEDNIMGLNAEVKIKNKVSAGVYTLLIHYGTSFGLERVVLN